MRLGTKWGYVLLGSGALSAAAGLLILFNAETVFHEIAALVLFVDSAVMIAGGALIDATEEIVDDAVRRLAKQLQAAPAVSTSAQSSQLEGTAKTKAAKSPDLTNAKPCRDCGKPIQLGTKYCKCGARWPALTWDEVRETGGMGKA